MPHALKRIISLFVVLVLITALLPCAFAAGGKQNTTISTPAQVLNFGLRGGHGPMSITKCTLHRGAQEDEVYLIVLSGASLSVTKRNNYTAFLTSAVSIPTFYLSAVKDAALSVIPEGSKVILAGHSVGGNTAQQFAADKTMRERYEILNVLACGSPTVVLFNREGSLHRLTDVLDPIPYISLAGPANLFISVSYELSDVLLKFENPHAKSYYSESTWKSYDCLGVKNGGAYLTCNSSDCVSFSLKL